MPNYLDQEGLGYYDGKMKVYMSNAISSAVAATYKPGGSRTFEQLPSLVAEYVGFIYNITNDFTTTSDFVEGAGTFCKAGANVGIVNVGTNQSPVYKYDLFSAFVDLSNYATLDDLPTKTSDLTNDSGYASAFTGTTAQWNSLTDAQKAKYELVCLTDDLGDSDNVKDLMVNKAQATVIARQDEATTASRSYVIKDLVYRGNILYKVIAPIASGDSFVVGTNISTTTVEAELSNKVDKVEGKGLSTNDYSDTEKGKVADNTGAIEAIVNVNGCCNVFDLDNPIEINGFSKTGTTLTNTHTDTKDFFEFMLWLWVGNTPSTLIFGTNITSNGHKVFDVTIPSNYDKLQFRHNGASRDLWVMVSNVPAGDYKISFDVTGHNPSVVGGLEISNIMLYDARLNPTGYVPYSMTNRELTERLTQSEFVSIGTDGVKTQKQLIRDLYALVDTSKISMQSKLVLNNANSLSFFSLTEKALDNRFLCFMRTAVSSAVGEVIETYQLGDGTAYAGKAYGGIEHETSSEVLSAGMSFTVYY